MADFDESSAARTPGSSFRCVTHNAGGPGTTLVLNCLRLDREGPPEEREALGGTNDGGWEGFVAPQDLMDID